MLSGTRAPSKWQAALNRAGNRIGIDLQYYLPNGFWVVLGVVISAIAGFATAYLLSNYLSVEEYGRYKYLLTLVSSLAIFSLPGTAGTVFRYTALGCDGVLNKCLRLSLWCSVIGSVILAAWGSYLLVLHGDSFGMLLLASSVLFPLNFASSLVLVFLRGKGRFKAASLIDSAAQVLVLLALTMLINIGASYIALALLTIAIPIVIHAVTLFVERVSGPAPKEYKGYLQALTIANVLGILSSNINVVLIPFLTDTEVVAQYAIAAIFYRYFSSFAKSLSTVFGPRLVGADLGHVFKRIRRFAPLALLCACVSIAGAYLFLPAIILALFPKYTDVIGYACLSFVGALALPFHLVLRRMLDLSVRDNNRLVVNARFTEFLVQLALIIPLVSGFGLMGLIVTDLLMEGMFIVIYGAFIAVARRRRTDNQLNCALP